jgi:uncharacterized membrane protein
VSARLFELLDLIARWVHVIAGIMWIGNSLLFNWLDRNLRPRGDTGVTGDIWLVHSGGFYLVEKNTGEQREDGTVRLPQPLHWFKWQAYTTWLSGAVLLVVVYYAGSRALLVDPAIAPLSAGQGTAVAVGVLAGGVLLYELLWRTIGARAGGRLAAGALSLAGLVAAVYALTHLLSGRAAFLHVGALLGSIMAANVAGTIMPSQRELVGALASGRQPSQAIADRAKERSIHNNYLTFPVLLLMVSAHFPTFYAHQHNWLLLLVLAAAGAAVRHVMNIRFGFRGWVAALAGVVAAALLLLMAVAHLGIRRDPPPDAPSDPGAATAGVDFAEVRSVIDRRCATCHSMTPSDVSLGTTPGGVAFDTPPQISALAARIRERAVVTRTMPPANRTAMTDAERALLRRWTESAAP